MILETWQNLHRMEGPLFMLITERLKEQKDFSKVDTVIADYFLDEDNEMG